MNDPKPTSPDNSGKKKVFTNLLIALALAGAVLYGLFVAVPKYQANKAQADKAKADSGVVVKSPVPNIIIPDTVQVVPPTSQVWVQSGKPQAKQPQVIKKKKPVAPVNPDNQDEGNPGEKKSNTTIPNF